MTSGEPKVLRLEEALDGAQEVIPNEEAEFGNIWQPACVGLPGDWTEYWLAQYSASAAAVAATYWGPTQDTLQLPDVLPSFAGAVIPEPMATRGSVNSGEHPDFIDEAAKRQIVKRQVEHYLSDRNLRHDEYFHKHLSSSQAGWLDAEFVLSCPRMQALGVTADDMREALQEGKSRIETKEQSDAATEKRTLFIRRPDGAPLPKLEPRAPADATSPTEENNVGKDTTDEFGFGEVAKLSESVGWFGDGSPLQVDSPACGFLLAGCGYSWTAAPEEAAWAPGSPAVVLKLSDALFTEVGGAAGAETPQLLKGSDPDVAATNPAAARTPEPAARRARGGELSLQRLVGGEGTPSTSASDRASDADEATPVTQGRKRGGRRADMSQSPGGVGQAVPPTPATPEKISRRRGHRGAKTSCIGVSAAPITPTPSGRRAKNGELRAPKVLPASMCQ